MTTYSISALLLFLFTYNNKGTGKSSNSTPTVNLHFTTISTKFTNLYWKDDDKDGVTTGPSILEQKNCQ